MKIVISRRARADFKLIWHYIAQDNPAAADNLLLALGEKIDTLTVHPEIGVARDDIRAGARMLVHGNYIVLYELDRAKERIEIVAIVHGARNLGDIL